MSQTKYLNNISRIERLFTKHTKCINKINGNQVAQFRSATSKSNIQITCYDNMSFYNINDFLLILKINTKTHNLQHGTIRRKNSQINRVDCGI